MTDENLKKITKIVRVEIGDALKPVNKKLDGHDSQFKSITKKLDEHSQRLESLYLDMTDVQKKTDLLPDIYDIVKGTKEKVDDHEERLQVLENAA
ncbi:MAG: hypothetical protein Q7S45_01655 [Candidatus Curtissbacteria bacterium]|nr:hypothetical protein [Candidatus Curtissbacteria bacterium]